MDCIFCKYDKNEYIAENALAFAIYDKFPVNKGHALIIPKRHFESFFEATEEEIKAIYSLLQEVKKITDDKFHPEAYNIGINDGYIAGQTVMHLHVHLIPRYVKDVENPRGGVRNIKKPLVKYD